MELITSHLSLEEVACRDGTPYPVDQGDTEDEQGRPWAVTRLQPLAETFEGCRTVASLEVVRLHLGPERPDGYPILVDSGYRTVAYDQRLYDADRGQGNVATPQSSQHPAGRALDIRHSVLSPVQLHVAIVRAQLTGLLPRLGGLGFYPGFVHIDVRPWAGHLAQWQGTRKTNVAA